MHANPMPARTTFGSAEYDCFHRSHPPNPNRTISRKLLRSIESHFTSPLVLPTSLGQFPSAGAYIRDSQLPFPGATNIRKRLNPDALVSDPGPALAVKGCPI